MIWIKIMERWKMYKKILLALIFAFIVIGASSAAEFKINEGFTPQTEYYSVNEENGMHLCTWDYEDELNQEFYLQNSSDYRIVAGDNNTYNITEDINGELADTISYLTSGNAGLNYGVLEIVEDDGEVLEKFLPNTPISSAHKQKILLF